MLGNLSTRTWTRAVVPIYGLVDKDGKELAQGSGAVFEKAV